jgi:hypothetical protein
LWRTRGETCENATGARSSLCTTAAARSLKHVLVLPGLAVMCIYSLLFMRFSLAIQPKNYILFACHFSNEGVQLNQMRRYLQWRSSPEGQVRGGQGN